MKLFAVMYLKGHLAMAMFLWPNATVRDCQNVNAEYMRILPETKMIKSGQIKLSDVRLACEYHPINPLLKDMKGGIKA